MPSLELRSLGADLRGMSGRVAADALDAMTEDRCYRWVAEDIRFNQIYERSLTKAKEIGLEASLTRAHRAWLAYRDAACAYEGQIATGGGAYEGLFVLACEEGLTRERADRLKAGLDE